MKVPHALITEKLLFRWGYIRSGRHFINWNGIWLRKVEGIWEYGNPNYPTIDENHPFIKRGEVEYLDELNAYQLKRGGRGLKYYNEQKQHDYYKKYGKNYQTIWQKLLSLIFGRY